jgi:NADP-dependent 3-hydroxy acid dehydrogenase YdfG
MSYTEEPTSSHYFADIERTKSYKFEHEDAKIKPEAIADSYWYLHTQPRTCFTNELDIRPYIEKW